MWSLLRPLFILTLSLQLILLSNLLSFHQFFPLLMIVIMLLFLQSLIPMILSLLISYQIMFLIILKKKYLMIHPLLRFMLDLKESGTCLSNIVITFVFLLTSHSSWETYLVWLLRIIIHIFSLMLLKCLNEQPIDELLSLLSGALLWILK